MKVASSVRKIVNQLNTAFKFEPHVPGIKQIGKDAWYATKVIAPKVAAAGMAYNGVKTYCETENYHPYERGITVADKTLTGGVNGAKVGTTLAVATTLFARYPVVFPLVVSAGISGAVAVKVLKR